MDLAAIVSRKKKDNTLKKSTAEELNWEYDDLLCAGRHSISG